MRLVSVSDYEAGVLALGAYPVGIVAIGAAPVGVVAVGFLPRGIVAIGCGAAVGVFAAACGLSVGAFSVAVGAPIGFRTRGLGGRSDLFGGLPDVKPRREPVPLEQLAETQAEGWTAGQVDRSGRLELLPALPDAVTTLKPRAQRDARSLRGKPVVARVRARVRAPEAAHYRAGVKRRTDVDCLAIEPARAPRPFGATVRYAAWTTVKLLAWSLMLGVAVYSVHEQLQNLTMTRHATLDWPAKVASAEQMELPVGTPCVVRVELRTNGHDRLHASPAVRCGDRILYEEDRLTDCVLQEQLVDEQSGRLDYWLRCVDEGSEESDDSSGRPGLTFDTIGHPPLLRVFSRDPPRWSVVIDVDRSAPRFDEPLLDGTILFGQP